MSGMIEETITMKTNLPFAPVCVSVFNADAAWYDWYGEQSAAEA